MAAAVTMDLVVLVADKNQAAAVKGLLSRPQALGIRSLAAEMAVHPNRDPGCRRTAHQFLRREAGRFSHALVIFDREGCGAESEACDGLEQGVRRNLSENGWGDRAAVLVIDPELENWVWSDSPHVEDALGWAKREPPLRDWLCNQGFLSKGQPKPPRPKEAMEATLRVVSKPRSSAIYYELAQKVSFTRCSDPAFRRLKDILQKWFGV